MSNFRGYEAAQRAYDNMAPPEDGPCECPECGGSAYVMKKDAGGNEDEIQCECCDGFGWIDADGEPFNPNAAEEAAADYADWKRDEKLTEGSPHV